MANRFFSPNQQFADNTGLPYAGGSLAFYASGTSTPLTTYSDSALTIANTNPVVLDSAGRAGNIFLQNLAYKVVLSDVNSNVIWTDDPVYSSDYSSRAKLTTGSGSPNGAVAGTAGSAGIGADTYWDSTNNILYVCTTTGNAASAVWTAINSATASAVVIPPQGYLTPTTGTPIIVGDVISSTSVYYTPYVGNLVPIYNGTSLTSTIFSELSIALVSSHTASTIYDFFVFNNSGVLTLVTGPAWSNSAAGSGARGTGASTTQLTRISGIWVNAVSMTARNGSTTYTIPANQATYLGSLFVDGVAGQVTCHRTYGQARKFGIWNAYNRVPIFLKCGDPTASWTYAAGSAARIANGISNNSLTIFSGLAEEVYDLSYSATSSGTTISSNIFAFTSFVAVNSSTAGKSSSFSAQNVTGSGYPYIVTQKAEYLFVPSLGINTVAAYESNPGAVTNTMYGTEINMLLSAKWRV